jgi:quinolinate synthase
MFMESEMKKGLKDPGELIEEIKKMKREKNTAIYGHFYQNPAIQEVADAVGDDESLNLRATKEEADQILVCGVGFTAENVKLMAPDKRVFLAAPDAVCPMNGMIHGEFLDMYRESEPQALILADIHTSAEVKARADICCTESNAVAIARHVKPKRIFFVADGNLGALIQDQVPEKEILAWEGYCPMYQSIRLSEVKARKAEFPQAWVMTHSRSPMGVMSQADFIGGAAELIAQAMEKEARDYLVGAEAGLLEQLRKICPGKNFHLLSPALVCLEMKKTTLEGIWQALRENGDSREVDIPPAIRPRAAQAILRMHALKRRIRENRR